jgi:AhpD family alkylhydroperoxidase
MLMVVFAAGIIKGKIIMLSTDKSFREKAQKLKQDTTNLFKAAPEPMRAFQALAAAASKDGLLPARVKELMALAVAIATRCEGCILHHVEAAVRHGASRVEIAETIAVAVEMAGGPAVVYGGTALAVFDEIVSR